MKFIGLYFTLVYLLTFFLFIFIIILYSFRYFAEEGLIYGRLGQGGNDSVGAALIRVSSIHFDYI